MTRNRRGPRGGDTRAVGDDAFPAASGPSAGPRRRLVTPRSAAPVGPVESPPPVRLPLHARGPNTPDDPLTGFVRALARWKARNDYAERASRLTASERRGMFGGKAGQKTDEIIDYEIIA